MHKRIKIAPARVVSVTGYSLSFILLCLAGSIQMRWVPSGFVQTAEAGSCTIPTRSDHQKLTFTDTSAGSKLSVFAHPALKKHDLLPAFATTRVAKQQSTPRPAPDGLKADHVAASTYRQIKTPVPARRAEIAKLPHHTPPVFETREHTVVARRESQKPRIVSNSRFSTPLAREHHTPPRLKAAASGTNTAQKQGKPASTERSSSATPVAAPRQTTAAAALNTASVPLPLEKPGSPAQSPAKIGTITLPIKIIEPASEQAVKVQPRSSATAGFAFGRAATRASSKPLQNATSAEKPPVFRKKPVKTARRPVSESHCLSLALYYEARNESTEARIGLAKVIISRVKSRQYPNTVCGVVYQNAHLRGQCAFSFACDGLHERPQNLVAWKKAQLLSQRTLCGKRCSRQKLETPLVQNVKFPIARTAVRGSGKRRQITDHGMRNMGRDGVNEFDLRPAPLF